METESLEEFGLPMGSDENEEQSASSTAYTPPSQFKPINLPPLVQEVSSDNMELWLIRIQDNQLGPEDFKEKQIAMHLKTRDDKLGCFQNSKGIQYDVLDLHRTNNVHSFAFLPKNNAVSLDALRISRHVAFVRSLDPDIVKVTPVLQEDQCHQIGEALITSSSKRKHRDSLPMHMPRDGISVEHMSSKIDPEENETSVMESLQKHEEQIPGAHFSKSGKKKLKKEGLSPSPQK